VRGCLADQPFSVLIAAGFSVFRFAEGSTARAKQLGKKMDKYRFNLLMFLRKSLLA
jgi:hypothetical protein